MSQLKIFIELTRLNKPTGIMLLFWPCSWGLAYAYVVEKNLYQFLYFLLLFFLGSVLMRSAGCIVNDIVDKDIDKKSYIPKDRSLKDLIKISRAELNELRDIEKKLTEQLKLDKLKMNQYKEFLNNQLTERYRDLDDKEEEILHKTKLKQSNTEYLQDQLDLSVKGQLKILAEKEKIIDTKLSREKIELDIANGVIAKRSDYRKALKKYANYWTRIYEEIPY